MLALQILSALLLVGGTILLLGFVRWLDLLSETPAPLQALPVPGGLVRTAPPAASSDWLRPAA